MFLARGRHGDLDVLAEGGEEVHQAFDGKGAGAVAHQGGNVRLLDAEDLAGIGLLEAAFLDEAVDLEGKLGLQELLLGIRETKVGKNVSAAFFHSDWFSCSGSHVSSAFLCGGVPPRPGDGRRIGFTLLSGMEGLADLAANFAWETAQVLPA